MELSFMWIIALGVLCVLMSRRGISCVLPFQRKAEGEQQDCFSAFCFLTPVETETLTQQALPSGVVVLMFTDLEGFTTYVDKHGDNEAFEMLKRHQQIIENYLQHYDGRLIKTIGDGTLVSFASARNALKCAAEIQNELYESNFPLRLRIGLHAGEPIQHEENDLIGHTVNIAERVMSQASGNQIYVTDVVKNLAGEMQGYQFTPLGNQRLKGISTPQCVHEFQPIAPLAHPLDSILDKELEVLENNLRY